MSSNDTMIIDSFTPQSGSILSNSPVSAGTLQAALSTAQQEYSLSNPESFKTHNEACMNFPGGNTRTVLHASPFPMAFGSSMPTFLWDFVDIV
tara:strand:+ start:103 stop:381 length:279 start_codon:yes stop_codon:yes gene_type:complete